VEPAWKDCKDGPVLESRAKLSDANLTTLALKCRLIDCSID